MSEAYSLIGENHDKPFGSKEELKNIKFKQEFQVTGYGSFMR